MAPTLNFVAGRGLRYAIAFDDQPAQVIDVLANDSLKAWETSVKGSARESKSSHNVPSPGYHTLKFCMVDLRSQAKLPRTTRELQEFWKTGAGINQGVRS